MRHALLAALVGLAFSPSVAEAHYLWVVVDSEPGEHGTAQLYFEESPAPGNGSYLEPFEKFGKMWVRTPTAEKPIPLEMSVSTKPGKKWLSAPLPVAAPRSVESYGKFGVYSYNNADVLLHYYARYFEAQDSQDIKELGKSDKLDLQIVPREAGDHMELTVFWQGKPAPNRPVSVRGPKKFRKNLTTDEAGQVRFPVKNAGRYTCRTYVELKKTGKDAERDYQLIRHHSSLTIDLPLGES